jgi:hypothetical protein
MERDAYTIPEFLSRNGGLSRAMFYKELANGRGPRIMKVGSRTLISVSAAEEWRRKCETTEADATASAEA